MRNSKISVFVLATILFSNSVACLSAPKNQSSRRIMKRGTPAYGTLVTPGLPTLTPKDPGEISIITPVEPEIPDVNPTPTPTPEPTPTPDVDNDSIERNRRIKEIKTMYQQALGNAQLECIGIADTLEMIQGLTIGTTVASSAGTLASGGSLTSQFVGEKKSREGLETGLMVGATITSTASTITSAISLSKMDELIKKVKSCNKHIKEIAPIADDLLDEEVDPDDKIIYQVGKIKSACTGFDEQNIESIKGQLIGTTITSGVGAASGIVGTVAKGIGNKNVGEEVKNKADLASKIATGITTATSATGVILSSTTLAGLNKNKDTADKCEKTLMQY